jgi:RND family efflux transporter MFP subunit
MPASKFIFNSKMTIVVAVPFFILVFLLVAAGAGKVQSSPQEIKLHLVNVKPIEMQAHYKTHRLAVGQIEASKRAVIGFELGGTFIEALVDDGQSVEKGDLLGRLDTKRLNAELAELRASLTRTEADARLAQLSQTRIEKLVAQNLESAQSLDEAEDSTISAKARVEEVKARISSVQVQLDKSKLYAPFSGAVIRREVDSGSVVGQGQSVFVMQEEGSFEARIALGADDALNFNVGQGVSLIHHDKPIPAKIKTIAKQRTRQTRTVDVILSLDVQDDTVLPGNLISLSIEKEVYQSGTWVPRSALTSSLRGLWNVYVVEEIDGEQRISPRSVNVLYNEGEFAFIAGAIKPSELLVINGNQRLVVGQQVSIQHSTNQQFTLGR